MPQYIGDSDCTALCHRCIMNATSRSCGQNDDCCGRNARAVVWRPCNPAIPRASSWGAGAASLIMRTHPDMHYCRCCCNRRYWLIIVVNNSWEHWLQLVPACVCMVNHPSVGATGWKIVHYIFTVFAARPRFQTWWHLA